MAKNNTPDRRAFLQRAILALGGAAVGGTVGYNIEDKGEPVMAQPQPGQRPLNPGPQHPFFHDFPEEAKKGGVPVLPADNPPPQGGAAPVVQARPLTPEEAKEARKQDRAAKGAAAGALSGLAVHMAARVSASRSAHEGATQNDPERVEWERRQQQRRDIDDQNYGPGRF